MAFALPLVRRTGTFSGTLMRRSVRTRATAPSLALNRFGWHWVDVDSADENYIDLAFLLARGCTIQPQVGCVLVSGVEDGGAARQQGQIIASGINSFLVQDMQYGRNNGSTGRRKPDCHAEANAVAECALHGLPLRGASCYVTKQPCISCYTLLAAAGIREIVAPEHMTERQVANAAHLGIELRIVRCTEERKARRDALTMANVDRDAIRALRREKALGASGRYKANLQRLSTFGNLDVGGESAREAAVQQGAESESETRSA